MRFYLASRYSRRLELEAIAAALRAAGHIVTSTWHDGHLETGPTSANTPENETIWASEDMLDLLAAEAIIAFTERPDGDVPGRSRGGRHVEYGIALGLKKHTTIVVGPIENIFYHLADWKFVSLNEFFQRFRIGPTPLEAA